LETKFIYLLFPPNVISLKRIRTVKGEEFPLADISKGIGGAEGGGNGGEGKMACASHLGHFDNERASFHVQMDISANGISD